MYGINIYLNFQNLVALSVLAGVAITAVKLRKLTLPAGVCGFFIGLIMYLGPGWAGLASMAAFFIIGTAATSWGYGHKQRLGLAEKDAGERKTGQVLANGGVASILGILCLVFPSHKNLFTLMIAACFSSAAADTTSSELGNIYGSRYFNIISLKEDNRGLDGVISFEGTLLGMAASLCIALVHLLFYGWHRNLLLIIIAGIMGNVVDSILGATLERKGYLDNNQVNCLNTVAAAISVAVLTFLLKS